MGLSLIAQEFNEVGSENSSLWNLFSFSQHHPQEELPCGYSRSLDMFRQLLLIRSWCPDRTLSQARRYIRSECTFVG